MMNKARTLQSTLFLSFSLVFLILLILINSFYYSYARKILLSDSREELQEISLAISSDLDGEIGKVDTVSINIAYSEMISQSFQNFPLYDSRDARGRHKELSAALIAIVGPQSKVKQAYLYSYEGFRLSVGMISTMEELSLEDQSWYEKVTGADGQKVLSGPVEDPVLSEASTYQEQRLNILLRRIFFNSYGDPVGIMELVKDSKDVFASAEDYAKRTASRVVVLNGAREIIYPPGSENESFLLAEGNRPPGEALSGSYYYDDSRGWSLAAFTVSDYTGWTTIVSQSKGQVLEDTNRFTLLMAAVIVPVLLLVLLVSYFVSRRVTRPLKVIHNFIEDMQLFETVDDVTGAEMPLNELEELNRALVEMRDKMRLSLSETLEAHEQEGEARMQALQAQVNPHFMHNTINTISAMAEEGMNEDIVTMCLNVSGMMRYISDQNRPVSLKDEIDYTVSYLETMKLRFREKLEYTVEVSGDPEGIITPRLIIQPLAENAVKHGTTRRHPWKFDLSVRFDDREWLAVFRDNGPGFDGETEELLNSWTPEEDRGREPGVGLANILHRLMLWYGREGYIFRINNIDGGAEVTIGGQLSPRKADRTERKNDEEN